MTLLTPLILAHLIGDFLLQPDAMVRHKKTHLLRSGYLYLHIALHGLLAGLLTASLTNGLIVLVSHYFIDAAKLLLTNDRNNRVLFLADQLLHLAVILGIVALNQPESIITTWNWLTHEETLRFVCCVVFLTLPASVIIRTLISGWTPSVGYTMRSDDNETPLMSAGKYIGMLERLFVFGFVITGHFEAIGFLLAAKSIFRFGDLKDALDRNLTEYVLIGTLLSFGFAITAGWIYTAGFPYFSPK